MGEWTSQGADPITDLQAARDAVSRPSTRPHTLLPSDVVLRLIREVERVESLRAERDALKAQVAAREEVADKRSDTIGSLLNRIAELEAEVSAMKDDSLDAYCDAVDAANRDDAYSN